MERGANLVTQLKKKARSMDAIQPNILYIKSTWGCSALKGGIPTISSNKITPTDHQSAVAPAENQMIADD